ncbi:hypothetical protein [Actinophytocola algeriensis]|uniref:Uncharacterized protein n=1 Tax=Actinophytocola algeriensis TaxID=1768010 RepID=A0A7W7VD69_9PSEU|nr:hypothetical protein [Actinophytocola algeriensis]MBB4905866.1 hypothetical protein [Actinophytocola algeriensis]MBE1472449.1 hypothetical protein [Actinophytocola algeriensis]
MDKARAIQLVLERIRTDGDDYPTDDLTAAPFDGGWCVYAPVMIADDAPDSLVTRSVFLVSGTGRVEQVTSDAPVADATLWFEESCIWFSASAGPGEWSPDTGLPSHPDLGGSSRPRPPADYDRAAVDVLARALTNERDFSGWLGDRLRDLADLLGGGSRLVARSPHGLAAGHVRELLEPYDEERPEVWRTWPRIDTAGLPEVDTTGWVLTPFATMVQFLEELEEQDDAQAVADTFAEQAERAPRWRACGVADLMPQLVALRRTTWLDNWLDSLRELSAETADDPADDFPRMLMTEPTPEDPDVDALLRIAIAATQNNREVMDIDAATTAAYRRVLDRMGLPFENYGYEAMFE